MRTVTVKVTEEHIARGIRRHPTGCPVAQAIVQATGKTCAVSGTTIVFYSTFFNREFDVVAPDSVASFVYAFDHEAPVLPLKFQLELPE